MASLVESPGELIAQAQNALIHGEQVHLDIEHVFTPGLYTRICRIPAGTLLVTAMHQSEHPFVLLEGRCQVFSEKEGMVIYEAPMQSVTMPGTKRIIYAEEDTRWITFHATELTDPLEIGDQLIMREEFPEGHVPQWIQDAIHYQNEHITNTKS